MILPFGEINSDEFPFDPKKLELENPFEDEEVRDFFINKLGVPEELLDNGAISIIKLDDSIENKNKISDLITKFIKKIADGEINNSDIVSAMQDPDDPLNKEIMDINAEMQFLMESYKSFKHHTKTKIAKILSFLHDMGENCCIINSPMLMKSWLYFDDGINNIKLFKNIEKTNICSDWKDITFKSKKISIMLYPSTPKEIKELFKAILSSN